MGRGTPYESEGARPSRSGGSEVRADEQRSGHLRRAPKEQAPADQAAAVAPPARDGAGVRGRGPGTDERPRCMRLQLEEVREQARALVGQH